MPNKKLTDKQLDKEIAKEKNEAKATWAKRWDTTQDILLISVLVGSSVYSYANGLFEISNQHLQAMTAMLVAIACTCLLMKKRV